MKKVIEDEPVERAIAELAAHLVEAEDVLLPSLEARVRDVRDLLKEAYSVLSRLELQVTKPRSKNCEAKSS